MEPVATKIGKSIEVIPPKEKDSSILKSKKTDIFENAEDWKDFRSSVIPEDQKWDTMRSEGSES